MLSFTSVFIPLFWHFTLTDKSCEKRGRSVTVWQTALKIYLKKKECGCGGNTGLGLLQRPFILCVWQDVNTHSKLLMALMKVATYCPADRWFLSWLSFNFPGGGREEADGLIPLCSQSNASLTSHPPWKVQYDSRERSWCVKVQLSFTEQTCWLLSLAAAALFSTRRAVFGISLHHLLHPLLFIWGRKLERGNRQLLQTSAEARWRIQQNFMQNPEPKTK